MSQIASEKFLDLLAHIGSVMILSAKDSSTDNGKGVGKMVYLTGKPDDPEVFIVKLFRGHPVQVTAIVRDVEVGTCLYTCQDIPETFRILLPDFL